MNEPLDLELMIHCVLAELERQAVNAYRAYKAENPNSTDEQSAEFIHRWIKENK